MEGGCNFTDVVIAQRLAEIVEAIGARSGDLKAISDELARLNDNLEAWHPELQRQITGMNTALHGIWNCCVTGRKLSELLLKVSMQHWQKMPDAKWNIYCGLKQEESDAGDEIVQADGTIDFSVSTGPGDTTIGPETLPPEFGVGKPGTDGGPQVGPGTSGDGSGSGAGGSGDGTPGGGTSGGPGSSGDGTGAGGGSSSGGGASGDGSGSAPDSPGSGSDSGGTGAGDGTSGGSGSGSTGPGGTDGDADTPADPDAPNNDPDTGGWCYPQAGSEDRS